MNYQLKKMSLRKPFGLETVFKGETLKFKNSIKLYQNGGVGYVKENVLTKNIFMIDKYKVFCLGAEAEVIVSLIQF